MAPKTFLELLEFQGSWNLIGQDKVGGIPDLITTKQKHLIDSLVPRMSIQMLNLACFLNIEVWKQRDDWTYRKGTFHRITPYYTHVQ